MYVEKAYSAVDSDSSVGWDVKPGGPLGAFREEQAMSRHRVSPSPFLSSPSHTTQLHYTNSYTCSHPNLNFLQYTQILVPHVMWSAQAVRELKMDHTQRKLSALCGTRSTQVQWAGIGTHTMTMHSGRPCCTDTRGKVTTFLDESSLWTKPGLGYTNQT